VWLPYRFVFRNGSREVDFLHFGWGHTRGDGFVWLPKERVLCTGDAAVNGPRNKFWDADVANWPKTLDQALALQPAIVLPGHGDPGGPEICADRRSIFEISTRRLSTEKAPGMTEQQVMRRRSCCQATMQTGFATTRGRPPASSTGNLQQGSLQERSRIHGSERLDCSEGPGSSTRIAAAFVSRIVADQRWLPFGNLVLLN
jgi:glyoxylase-like metal-dependent hydrolase (beta-lactamase superfamily II)